MPDRASDRSNSAALLFCRVGRKNLLGFSVSRNAQGDLLYRCLGARDLMNEMSADEQLGLSVRQFANRVRLPYFLKECLSHLTVTEQPFALEGKVFCERK